MPPVDRSHQGPMRHSGVVMGGGLAVVALLALLTLGGPFHAAIPAPGTDVMPAAGSVEMTVDGIGTDYVRLTGDVTIVRHPPDPGSPVPDDSIPIEIVSLNLIGFSPVFGRVGINPCVNMASTGSTLRMMGVESPSDSFFDVWLDISLPDLGMDLTQGAYFRIEARTTTVPFLDVFTGAYPQMIPLVDEGSGTAMGSLTHVALDPNPRVDILSTEARLDWTIGGAGGGPEMVALSGQSIVVASDTFVPPMDPDHPEFNTEIIAMNLTGMSPTMGDLSFMEQASRHSPGQVTALGGGSGPSQFPADSFFDVFFDVQMPAFVVRCQTPWTFTTEIDFWPPFGIPYVSSGPCDLFEPGGTQPVGTLNSFSWTWTLAAGQCVDADGDGVDAPPCGTDCDDNDPGNYPGNVENCSDQVDNNCNQAIDCLDPLCLDHPCDDGDSCTQGDVCVQPQGAGGFCQGAPVVCDDGNPCTQDSCDPGTGSCRFVPTPDVACDDGDSCTVSDICVPDAQGGPPDCQGTPLNCDDGNLCTTDFCDPVAGQCVNRPIDCSDGDGCTGDSCNPASGQCTHGPKDCDDLDLCTSDSCQAQACLAPDNGGGTADLPVLCPYNADLRSITARPDGKLDISATVSLRSISCPLATPAVCSFPSPLPGVDCSQPGGTLGGEGACANAILTTWDALYDPFTGNVERRTIDLPVSFEVHAAPRMPGDPVQSFATDIFRLFGEITPADMDPDFELLRIVAGNDFGLPSPGHTTLTQAGSDWTVDSFFDITFRYQVVGRPGSILYSGVNGTWESSPVRFRTGGGCVNAPVTCDDSNPCTADTCDPDNGSCQHQPAVGAPCDDGDLCTQDDQCVPRTVGSPICQGAQVSCDDADVCTLDSCDPPTGLCVHPPIACNDFNACTTDSCNPIGGCAHQPVPVLEPNPIMFTSQTQYSWPPTPDATHWNAYRGTIPSTLLSSRLPGSVYDHLCFESADAFADGAMVTTDTQIPLPGTALYYLQTGEGICGESVAGHPSAGADIPTPTPCPTPP